MDNYIEYIGILAALCTTGAFLPQLIKLFKTKAVQDISSLMYLIMIVGVILWIVYGLHHTLWPVVIANSFTLAFSILILSMKLFWDKS